MSQYPHILQRVFDTPLLIQESKLRTILTVLSSREGFRVGSPGALDVPDRFSVEMSLNGQGRGVRRSENGYLVVNDMAILEVMGTLVQRCSGMDAASGMCSYENLTVDFTRMMADPDVSAVLMIIDSPGGDATSGVWDLADQVYAAREKKPVYAYAHDVAASAAYLIGSAATELYVPETGVVGSVGVVTAHMDVSKMAEQKGVAVTYIYAGEHKIDGNPFEPLPEGVRKKTQARVDDAYRMFVARVAQHRAMPEQSVIGTQAEIYYGHAAVEIGFADGVMKFDEYLGRVLAAGSGNRANTGLSTQTVGETTMSDKDTKAGSPAPETKPVILSAEQVTEQQPQAAADLTRAGAQAERTRISAILEHEHAKGREQLAAYLAFKTEMAPEAAADMLAASPVAATLEQTAKPRDPFLTLMNSTPDPDVGADGAEGELTPQGQAAALVEMARKSGAIR